MELNQIIQQLYGDQKLQMLSKAVGKQDSEDLFMKLFANYMKNPKK